MAIRSYPNANRAYVVQAFVVASALVFTGCASTEKRAEASAVDTLSTDVSQVDPFEDFNRSVYAFNMGLDKYLFKPVADGYKFITPDFMETGVSNFFSNLKGINVVLNDVLQGKFQQSAADAGRFLTNTTIGMGGLIDVASEFGLHHNIEDFGQTLAVWGVEEGAYLVLPIMGPTTLRDGGGLIVDKAANPGTYVPGTEILEGISDRANAEGALNFINEAALDPYVFTRESFLQYRRHLINDGKHDSSHYALEIDEVVEASADLNVDQADANERVAETNDPMENTHQGASESADGEVMPVSAFDNMVQSFEEAMLKIDQYHAAPKRSRRI